MWIVTMKFVNEQDKDELLELVEEAEMDGKLMGPFDTEVQENA